MSEGLAVRALTRDVCFVSRRLVRAAHLQYLPEAHWLTP